MGNLHISLFGQLRIEDESRQLVDIEARRAQELFCYLLLNRQRMHEREQLATLFWCDKSASQSKRYLRQTLWQVQSVLNQWSNPTEHLLCVEYERIGINPAAHYWLDIASFEAAFAAVEKTPGRELSAQQVELLHSALPLYQGDLLEGWYQDWCIHERERRQNMYLSLLGKLLLYSEAQGDYASGLQCGAQILRYDRAREQTHRQLMRLHYLAGDRTAAIHQYEACIVALQEELNVGPSKKTVTLYRQICAEQLNRAETPEEERLPLTAALSVEPMHQLAQIQATLNCLQEQVAQLMSSLSRNSAR